MARRILLLLLLSVAVAALGRATAVAQTQGKRAAIVIRFADGQNVTQCIPFAEDGLTGEELLERAGVRVVIDASYGEGGAVCAINNTGCPVNDCFCQCQDPTGGNCTFWSYWHWQDNTWQFSSSGAGGYTIADGALEGWSWGKGDGQTGIPPPAFTFSQICDRPSASNPTPINAQPTPSNRPPEGVLESTALALNAGSCAVLTWVVYDAARITLNGSPVIAQDRMEVCPTTTQTYTLLASNNAGQLTRELTIAVQGSAPATVAPELPEVPIQETPVLQQPVNPVPVLPEPLSAVVTQVPETPELTLAPTVAVFTPVIPAATPTAILPKPTEPLPALALTLTALPTPVSTAARGGEGSAARSTPTPILLALADVAPAPDPATEPERPQAAEFDPALLPGYGAFLLIAAILLGAAAWVWQRRTP